MAYYIWIRTPFKIVQNATGIELYFTRAPSAAGEEGQNLKPGQGAWPDRPLYANEPSCLKLPLSTDVNGKPLLYDYLLEGALLRAAIMTPNTLISIGAEDVGGIFVARSGLMGGPLTQGTYGGNIKIQPATP